MHVLTSHYSVNDQQEQKGRQQTSLANSGEHLNQFWKDSIVDDSVAAVVVGLLRKSDVLLTDLREQLVEHLCRGP